MSDSFIALELLDAESGHVLQSWELGGRDVIQLGRSPESDLVFSSPYVSRTHACLRCGDDGWELMAISRGGIFVAGKRIENLVLIDGVVFRLADRGPWIRFRSGAPPESTGGSETICFDSSHTPLLALDGQQLEREVQQITEGDYFQQLKRRMAQLRSRGTAGQHASTEESL